MPLFTEWTSDSPLPTVGDPESIILDFKQLPSKRPDTGDERVRTNWDKPETAKDIAAFANAIGGTLVFGAKDGGKAGKHSKLSGFYEIDDALATDIEQHVSEVIGSHVSPVPRVTKARIRRGSHWLVAVNVWPFPGQAVGAWMGAANAYSFPVRGLDQTIPYRPEMLSMLMSPEIRRIAALLRTIQVFAGTNAAKRSVSVHCLHPPAIVPPTHIPDARGVPPPTQYAFNAMDEQENWLYLQLMDGTATRYGWIKDWYLPLDDVESVWRVPGDFPEWHIRVRPRSL